MTFKIYKMIYVFLLGIFETYSTGYLHIVLFHIFVQTPKIYIMIKWSNLCIILRSIISILLNELWTNYALVVYLHASSVLGTKTKTTFNAWCKSFTFNISIHLNSHASTVQSRKDIVRGNVFNPRFFTSRMEQSLIKAICAGLAGDIQ